jgi:NAD(P)-dependent dehydrogenase (short-subunit alcohol dehydrogenase family)
MDVEGKGALVTGAGAGIGCAVAERLASEGMAVVVADTDELGGAETVRRIEDEGGAAAFVFADVAAEGDARAMIVSAVRRFGGLDVLVNNAGGAPEPHFPEAEPEHWGRTLDVNLRGVMLVTQFGVRAMRGRGGAIVNVSSMAGVGCEPHEAPEYAAAKAGVVRLTSALGYLKEEAGIRVNCVCPGWVETPAVRRALDEMTAEERESLAFPPPPALIQPEEIADVVVRFVVDETLAGRVMLWPDGEQPRLIAPNATY